MKISPLLITLLLAALPALAAEDNHDDHAGEAHQEEGHDEHEEGVVELSPAQVEAAGIAVEAVSRRSLAQTLAATGQVGLDRYREVHLSPRVEGKVVRLVKLLGDRVQVGEPVIYLDSLPLGQAVATYLELKAERALATAEMARVEALRAEGIAAEKRQIEAQAALARVDARLDTAEEQLHLYGMTQAQTDELAPHHDHSHSIFALTSPIAGEVIALHATLGEQVGPETATAQIADLSSVWVEAAVYEKDLGSLTIGAEAWVTVAAYPGKRFPGRLDFIARTVDEETRTTRARIVVANPDERLLPGMFANVEIAVGEGEPVVAIPRAAILRDGEESICFVEERPGHFERRAVVLGEAGPTYIEIRSGLAEGERVVTRGGFILKSEAGKEGMGEGHEH
ncbi:MAG TPA: efflux RND transporter periplasmic adaptor subunit [bacterium]|jgi:cobalt-zinc-cadmium efflux system membrane fusion protein